MIQQDEILLLLLFRIKWLQKIIVVENKMVTMKTKVNGGDCKFYTIFKVLFHKLFCNNFKIRFLGQIIDEILGLDL